VLPALVGAFCAYLAAHYSAPWFIALGFVGLLGILLTSYWKNRPLSRGITTELAAMMTFFLGVLILSGARELAIALAIATLGVLFPKAAIKQWRSTVIPQGPTGKPPP
jgi:uncharacterized membrane protein (DUF4010 family)